jgi:hypothetical protein
LFRLGAPGTGAGGEAVVEIATLLLGSLNVMNPIAAPSPSVPLGRPDSKSSTMGSGAASAGTTDANGETNRLINKLKITIPENAGLFFFIVILLMKLELMILLDGVPGLSY